MPTYEKAIELEAGLRVRAVRPRIVVLAAKRSSAGYPGISARGYVGSRPCGGALQSGLALAQSGKLEEATRELNQAISLDPQYTDARIQLGLVLGQQNDSAGAANVFREILRRNPNFAEGHNNLGLIFLQAGDLRTAEKEFSESLRLKPGYAEAHYNLGLALHQDNKEEESRAEFEKAFEICSGIRETPAAMKPKSLIQPRLFFSLQCRGEVRNEPFGADASSLVETDVVAVM